MSQCSRFSIPDIPALIFMFDVKEKYRSTIVSTNEVFCSPNEETVLDEQGRYKTLKVPDSDINISSVLDLLPPEQYPELIVIKIDASQDARVRGLDQVKCKKVFIAGGTHIFNKGISSLIQYLSMEKFDVIISDHNRQHVHFFQEAGFKNVIWLPGFNLNILPYPVPEVMIPESVFIGQAGIHHPVRRQMLMAMKQSGIRLKYGETSQEKTLESYHHATVSINMSLNGDANLRVYEVLGSGGFLLTDRLSEQSGLSMLFEEDKHFVYFDGTEDLINKTRYFLNHPEKVLEIRNRVVQEVQPLLLPEVKIKEFYDAIFDNNLPDYWKGDVISKKSGSSLPSGKSLLARIKIYEYVQRLQREQMHVHVGVSHKISEDTISDIDDLCRVITYFDSKEKPFNFGSTNLQILDLVIAKEEDVPFLMRSFFKGELFFQRLWIVNWGEVASCQSVLDLEEDLKKKGLSSRDINLWEVVSFSQVLNSLLARKRYSELESFLEKAFSLISIKPEDCFVAKKICQKLALKSLYKKYCSASLRYFRANPQLLHEYSQVLKDSGEEDQSIIYDLESLKFEEKNETFRENIIHRLKNTTKEQQAIVTQYLGKSRCEGSFGDKIKELLSLESSPPIEKPLNILLLTNLYPPQEMGGYGRKMYDYAEGLIKRGHLVTVLAANCPQFDKGGFLEPSYVKRELRLVGGWKDGVTWVEDSKEKIKEILVSNKKLIDSYLKEKSFDICLMGNLDFFIPETFLPSVFKHELPVVHHFGQTSAGYALEDTPTSPLYFPAFDSSWLKNRMEEKGYIFEESAIISPGAQSKDFYLHHSIKLDVLRICFAGLVLPYKGPHILIESLKFLKAREIPFTCEIAGDPTSEDFMGTLVSMIKEIGIEENVSFLGFQTRDQLKQVFGRNNVFVFPSCVDEAFGISQVEAMASGLLTLTTASGGAVDVIEDKVNGCHFKEATAQELGTLLVQIAQDPESFEVMAQRGQERALEIYDVEKSNDMLETLLKVHSNKHGKRPQENAF
jgi:glycosyltransferase involved in cell wall biosynthesis